MPIPLFTHAAQRNRDGLAARIAYAVMLRKMRIRIWPRIEKWIAGTNILDVGLGSGTNARFLQERGFSVTGLDVKNMSLYPDIVPVLYDGTTMPFSDRSFDTALLLHVLHHCGDFKRVLEETLRVARRVIVIEDTYRNWLEYQAIAANDMVANWEFFPHPYQSDRQWRGIFSSLDATLMHAETWSETFVVGIYGRYSLFVLEKTKKHA